ncbi:hypothetical protein J7F03_27955 [Streptomyces sp. ISL-43]|uniref:hypothetical protein n=1 Tax=Streptomyces sp. ISL-43 TaxID=2819183 RepID=UPI001BE6794E|nr:hypothetical protein [Streptomyces sp. ISL-43]MBT2450840.1 hypothetical protein [Streptomyces sp. ISL-43]
MSGEIEGGAAKFERAVNWLRQEVRAVAASVAPGVEPRVKERTDDRYSVGGAMGKRFSLSLFLPDTPYETGAAAANDAFVAAGWRTEPRQAFGGRPVLKAMRDGFEAGAGAEGRTHSRRCMECGLGMDCPDCRGTGQEPVRGAGDGR